MSHARTRGRFAPIEARVPASSPCLPIVRGAVVLLAERHQPDAHAGLSTKPERTTLGSVSTWNIARFAYTHHSRMAWTQTNIDELEAAIASRKGLRRITFTDGQSAEFDAVDDALKLLADMRNAVAIAAGTSHRTRLAAFDKGV